MICFDLNTEHFLGSLAFYCHLILPVNVTSGYVSELLRVVRKTVFLNFIP